jgi:DDE superfamily endonuclease
MNSATPGDMLVAYCGQVGKQDNCQVAVSLSIANHRASLPVAYRPSIACPATPLRSPASALPEPPLPFFRTGAPGPWAKGSARSGPSAGSPPLVSRTMSRIGFVS